MDLESKLARLPYFGWTVLAVFVLSLIDPVTYVTRPSEGELAFSLLLGLVQVWIIIVLTIARCNHIGINRWHSAWVVLPFAWFYFIFRSPKNDPVSRPTS